MARKKMAFPALTGPELAVLLAYGILLCLALPHYQPWEDEGRAWVDARYFGLAQLVFHVLRYEGHPALWYLILWPLAHLRLPFLYLNFVSAGCGLAAVYVLLRSSPFPFFLRALLPFGFALAYEYAVVARSYCLFPLLGFLVAQEYRQPVRRPVRMAVLVGLFANLSIHATIVAVVFGVSYAWDLLRERRSSIAGRSSVALTWTPAQGRLAVGIGSAALLFVLVVLWPPRDLHAPVAPGLDRALHRVAPVALHPVPGRAVLLRASAALPSPPPPPPLALNLGMGSMKLRGRLSTVFVYPVATFAPLALLLQAVIFLLVWRRGKPILLLAHLLLGAFIVQVYLKLWHTGLLWVTLLLLLWAVWDERQPMTRNALQNWVAAMLALVCLLQLPWTFHALRFVRTHSTYPAQATAAYLRSLPPGTRIDGFDHAFTVLPYFNRYPFHLQQDVLDVPTALADQPDAILFRESTVSSSELIRLAQAGYMSSHNFCGTPFFPNQPLVPLCLVVLQKP